MLEYANEVSESLKLRAGYEEIKKKKKLKSAGKVGGVRPKPLHCQTFGKCRAVIDDSVLPASTLQHTHTNT